MIINISKNIKVVNDRIASACDRSGRSPAEVMLVAVSKNVTVESILKARDCGISIIGENRVQEAWTKYRLLDGSGLCWHMVGHLQTNKVRRTLEFMQVIQSLDSLHLAAEVDRAAKAKEIRQQVLLQVNTSGEASKFGVDPGRAVAMALKSKEYDHLQLTGLMTIGAWTSDQTRIRNCFKQLRELKEQLATHDMPLQHLSMGMSDDFEIAIEEGATIVRIGRAIFGERNV